MNSPGAKHRAHPSLIRQVLKVSRPCWPHLAGISLLCLLSTPVTLLAPLPLKIAVDSVLGTRALPIWLHALPWPHRWLTSAANGGLAICAILLLTIALLNCFQSLASWLLSTYTGEKLVHDFRGQLLFHAQRLSLSVHDRRGANDIAYRIQYDAPAIQNLFLQGMVPILSSVFTFVAMLVVTTRISWHIASLAAVLSPVLFVLARNSSRRVRERYDEVRELDSSAMLVLHEALSCLRAVKAFGQEAFEDELFRRKSRQRMTEQVRLASIQAGFHVLIGFCVALAAAVALVMGVTEVRQHIMTVGEFLLVMAYMAQLYEPLRTISTKLPELQSMTASLHRAFALLEETPELEDGPSTDTSIRVRGEVEFRNVSFQYTAGGRSVLNDISFHVRPGTRVGVVGPSGSGKSTLVNLLTRFYDPSGGSILIDATDLREYSLAELRQQFSIVLQEPMLFSTTVAGNIAYANPQASRAEVIEASKLANAHDFIERLPKGYDTLMGDGGVRLSGGERQRLAIARAFLKDSPMLILDEPTSSVDVRTEQLIMEALDKLMTGRTTFMIAHRLSTLEQCDTVLVLQSGSLLTVTNTVEEARAQVFANSVSRSVEVPAPGPVLVRYKSDASGPA
ncbi:MAG TPA: ABC transporter ATP-binding protein [Candidatus Saccharimonadales bacterium]|nr:ABC transporter ATP-binding protein [Candidatus Saccharimonadales bacterium]